MNSESEKKTLKEKNDFSPSVLVYRFFVGMIFGFANVIPGVSGGTAMVVFGVYERIIGIISNFKNRIKTDWKFFLPVVLGMGAAILLFGNIMHELLEANQQVMQMFFIGVIVFSVPAIVRKSFPAGRRTAVNIVKDVPAFAAFALMLGVMIWMAVAKANQGETVEAAAQGSWLLLSVKYLGCGALACATMIIPGISGSLVMVMVGVYGEIMAAIHGLSFTNMALLGESLKVLIPFGIGCVVGLLVCANLIRFLLKHFERVTYGAILGFVVGSVFAIFPGWSYLAPAIAFVVGGSAIIACDKLAEKVGK